MDPSDKSDGTKVRDYPFNEGQLNAVSSTGALRPGSLEGGQDINMDAEEAAMKQRFEAAAGVKTRNRTLRFAFLGAILVVGLGLVGIRQLHTSHTGAAATADASLRYHNVSIPLASLITNAPDLSVQNAQTLSINGQLNVNNSLVFAPTEKPATAIAGQLYFDQTSRQLSYYNGSAFVPLTQNTPAPLGVSSLGTATGAVAVGSGLAVGSGALSNTGVLTLQGQAGNLTLSGGPGIVVNGTTLSNSGLLSLGGQNGDITLGLGLGITGNHQLRNTGIISAVGAGLITVTNDGNGNITIDSAGGGGGGGTVSSPGGTIGMIAKFTGVQTIADSLLSDNGTLVTVGGNLSVTGTVSFTNALPVTSGGTGANSAAGARSSLSAAQSGANSDITSLSGLTTALSVAQGGIGVGTLATNGVIVGNGTSALNSVVAGSTGECLVSTAGAPTWIACPGASGVASLNGGNGALTLNNATLTGSTITINDATTAVKGIASFNSTNFTVTSGAVNTVQNINTTASPTFGQLTLTSSQVANPMLVVNNTNLAASGALLDLQLNGSSKFSVSPAGNVISAGTLNGQTISSSSSFTGSVAVGTSLSVNTITPTSSLTIGATGQSFLLQGNASSTLTATNAGNTTTLAFQTPTANVTYSFPTAAAGAYNICTTVGNCAGVGGGVTTPGGTANTIAKFTGSGTIGNSSITDNGTTVTVSGTLSVNTLTPTGALTIGATGQNLTLQGATVSLSSTAAGITNNLTFAAPSGSNKTVTVPNASGTVAVSASGPLALDSAGNITCPTCLTSGGGGGTSGVSSVNGLTGSLTLQGTSASSITNGGTTITINDATSAVKGLASFNATNLTVTSGNVNTVQDIAVASTPTFAGLNLTAALTVANGGTGAITATGARTNLVAAKSGANTDITSLSGLTTALSAAQGGTGIATTPSNGQLLIGNGSGYSLNTLSAGAGVTITNGAGTVTISAPGAGTCSGCANTSLSNLASVAINTSLLPSSAAGADLGSGTLPFGQLFLAGTSASPATNNFKITGASTSGTRTITLPDASGTVAVSASGNIALSAAGNITFTGTLGVANGGTGAGSLTTNGVLIGNGTSAISAITVGTTGQCLLGNTGAAPAFGSCPGGGGVTSVDTLPGALTISNTSGTGTTITINNAKADGSTEGIATFNSTNFQDNGSGVINTIQGISTSSTPTFASMLLTNGNSLTLGTASTNTGSIKLYSGAGSGSVTLSINNPGANNFALAVPTLSGNDTICTVIQNNCAGTGATAIGALDGGTANANAATISSGVLYLQSASASFPGVVNTTTQTFAGNKTFSGSTTLNNTTLTAGTSIAITGGNTASRPASPTEGMVYYDTTIKSLLTYANGKWQANRSTTTKIVAASNSTQAAKDAADYVATGTDDGTTINSALTALPAGGGTVYLMEGTYTLGATAISVPNNTTLAGAGPATLLTYPNSMASATYRAIKNTDTSTGTHVTIRDLMIDGNKANQTTGNFTGIYFSGMGAGTTRDGGKISNVVVKNMYGGSGISLDNSSANNTVIGSTAISNAGEGITAQNSSSNNTFTGNTALTNGNGGISAYSSNNAIIGNTAIGNQFGITAGANAITVTGNTAQGNTAYGIYLSFSSYSTVTGNTSSGNSNAGIYNLSGSYDIISGNKMHDNGGAIANEGIELSGASNNTITGNSVTDTSCTTTCYALDNGSSSNNYWADNTYSSSGANTATIRDTSTSTTYANQQDSSGNLVNRTPAGLSFIIGAGSANATLSIQGGTVSSQLSAPTLSGAVSNVGTAGSTTYRYQITALDGAGETTGSGISQTTTGNATLSGTNYNNISWTALYGAYQYNIYRCAGAGCSPLKIATVAGSATSYSDQAAGLPSRGVPGTNTTGGAKFVGGLQAPTVTINTSYAAMSSPAQPNVSTSTSGGTLAAATYYYQVTAIDAAGDETTSSPENSQITTGSASTVTVSWTAVTGASGYKLYRWTTSGGEKYLTSVIGTSFTDNGSITTAGQNPPTISTAYVSTNNANNNLQLTIGGNGTPTGQVYVSGTVPAGALSTVAPTNCGTNCVLAIQGRYAYVAGSSLVVYDVSNPAAPVQMNTAIGLGTTATAIAVQGRYVYIALPTTPGSYKIYDVSNPSSPLLVSTTSLFGSGTNDQIVIRGKYLYVATTQSSDAFIVLDDVSNPYNPMRVSVSNIGSSAHGLAVQGSYAFVTSATTPALYTIGYTNPASPTQVSNSVSGGARSLAIQGRYMYLADSTSNALRIYDISNPSSPSNVGTLNGMTGAFSVVVQGRYAYVTGTAAAMYTVDISNTTKPFLVGTTTTTYTNPTQLAVQGRYAYVVSSNGALDTYDLGGTYDQSLEAGTIETSNINVNQNLNVNQGASITGGLTVGQSAAVNGNLGVGGMFTLQNSSNTAGELEVLNGSNVPALSVNTNNNSVGIGGLANVGALGLSQAAGGSLSSGIPYYYRVTALDAAGNETLPSPESSMSPSGGGNNSLTISWTAIPGAASYRVYRGTYSGGESVYLATATSPFTDTGTAGTAGTPPGLNNTAAFRASASNVVFQNTTNSTAALQVQNAAGATILDTDTTNQRIGIGTTAPIAQLHVAGLIPTSTTGSVSTTEQGSTIVTQGRYAYVLTSSKFRIFDVSQPSSMTSLGSVSVASNGSLTVQGKYAYVTSRANSIYAIDISNPSSPTIVSTNNVGVSLQDSYIQGRYLFAVTTSSIIAYDMANPAVPHQLSTLSLGAVTTQNVIVQGKYAYVTSNNTFFVINISDPTNMTQAGTLATSQAYELTAQGRYVYIDSNSGAQVQAIDVSNPASPTSVSTVATNANKPVANQRYLYTGQGFGSTSFRVIDISNPASMSIAGTVNTPGAVYAVAPLGRYVYALDWSNSNLVSYDFGGEYAQSLEAGNIETSTSTVNSQLTVEGNASFQGAASFGQGVNINGDLGVSGRALFQNATNSASAFQVQNATGSSLLNVDSTVNTISLFSGVVPSLTSWSSAGTINGGTPQVLAGQTSVTANGYIYLMGGLSNIATLYSNTYYAKINADGTITNSTWTSGSALPYAAYRASSFTANGYVYYIGGNDNSSARSDVNYAKLNADGSLGSWKSTTSMPAGRYASSVVYLNGYVYIIGGINGTPVGTTYYAKVNADGTLGSWNTATGVLPTSGVISDATAVAANGYIYLMGGTTNGGTTGAVDSVYYIKPNSSTGDIGSNWSTSANPMPAYTLGATAIVSNGYVYYMGGEDNFPSAETTISYSPLPAAGGDLGAWTTPSTTLASARWYATSLIVNGYFYEIGGLSTTNMSSSTSTIYDTTTSRLKVAGSLDLVGPQSATLADGGSDQNTGSMGGSVTAGNGTFMGVLQVQGQATFNQSVAVNGSFSVGGIFSVDPSLEKVTIGPAGGDATGAILVLGNDTGASDPTGVNGAIYYNSGGVGGAAGTTWGGKLRCFEGNVWKDCIGMRDIAERRWGYLATAGTAPTGLTATGGIVAPNLATSATQSADAKPESAYNKFTSTNSATNAGGIDGPYTQTEVRYKPKLVTRIRADGNLTAAGSRLWVGLTNASLTSTTVPTTSTANGTTVLGIGYENGVNGGNFVCVAGNGTNISGVDTGVTAVSSTYYDIILDYTTNGTLVCSISEAGSNYFTVTNSATAPSSSAAIGLYEGEILTSGTTTRALDIAYAYLEYQ